MNWTHLRHPPRLHKVYNYEHITVLGLVRQKQAIGILGMIFASAGGIAWFFQAAVPALILWGIAIIIIFKLKRKRKK